MFLKINTELLFSTFLQASSLANCDYDQLEKLVNIYDPSELLCSKDDKNLISEKFKGKNIFSLDNWVFKMGYSYDKLISFFNVKNLKGYGIEDDKEGIVAAGAILFYLELTEHNDLSNITFSLELKMTNSCG